MFSSKFFSSMACLFWLSIVSYGQVHKNFKLITPTLNNKPAYINKTIQDSLGNIWMVYGDGILVYDGYNYKQIPNKTIFPNSGGHVEDIIADTQTNFWITSNTGILTRYKSKNGQFEVFNNTIKNQKIKTVYTTNKSVWLATNEGVLYRYANSKTDSITQILNNKKPVKNIKNIALVAKNHLFVSTENGKIFKFNLKTNTCVELIGLYTDYPGGIVLTTDKNNKLWIGTETYGIFVYDVIQKQFIQNKLFKNEKYNINNEMFITLFCDSDGYIWGGTDGGGLYKINADTGTINLFIKQSTNEFSLGSNTILNINEDTNKNLWICTNYGKLNVLPNVDNNINYHEGSANNTPQRILSIFKSSKNDLWLGTDGSGLTKVTFNPNKTSNETQYFNTISSLNKGFYIQSITEDNHVNIWFATYRNGLWFHNTKKNTFKKIDIVNSKQQAATDVRTLFKDSKGRIWAGSNISIDIFNANQDLLASFENNSHGLKGIIMESIIEDRNGTIWLGVTNGGLFKFNESSTNLKASTFINQSKHISNTNLQLLNVKSMVLGNQNELWCVNNNGKLLKFNTKTYKYSTFNNIQALNDVSFTAIIKEDDTNLWLSSGNGIFHLNTQNFTIKTYYSTDGLQDNTFLSRSAFKDRDGVLYFGGINGINYFEPKKISQKKSAPNLYINTIEILNQPLNQIVPAYSGLAVYNIGSLNLKSNQSSFSFKFSAIDNVLDPKHHYAYRLKGFNDNWVISGQERLATYTNIPYGNYTFEVKAGTKKGNWNIATKKIVVTIAPPIWKSFAAYLLYFVLFCLIVYALRVWYLLRKKLLLEKLIHKKENELHDLKMNFFTKMSHEIQTPITLILGSLEEMLKNAELNGNLLLNQRLKIIANNSNRLSRIAHELTLVRNKELNKLKLIATKNDLYHHIDEISLSFKELARKKHIDFTINCPKNINAAWYDKEKIEHVIYNLLSNAFKFTPKEGHVQLHIMPIDDKKQIKVAVSNTGSGIEKDELELIFNLFYQANTSKKNKGSGIGLALTKELIDLHKGTIEVQSSPFDGTVFTFTLPITKTAYADFERIITDDFVTPISNNTELQIQNQEIENNTIKKTILIVEDNFDLQTFLNELLVTNYNILLAENGEEGYQYAKSNFPDLILSDIMMPKLDGLEMCTKLQQDTLTKHIPVILLTAKNSTNSKISGLKSGAIEYINKPFNTSELLLKIKNIISSKEHIISKYRKEVLSSPEIDNEKNQDEIFLENMTSMINAKLNDANFKIEDLAESLHTSYSSLYRKCQTLTGKNLVEYITLVRLKKAAVLIAKYGFTISEAAFKVGFNDPKYFSKCFKKHYNKNPKEFEVEAKHAGIENFLKKYNLEHFNNTRIHFLGRY